MCLDGFADPILSPLYTITESTLMRSIGNFSANSKERSVFPDAVGPLSMMTFFDLKIFSLKVRHDLFANDIQGVFRVIMQTK